MITLSKSKEKNSIDEEDPNNTSLDTYGSLDDDDDYINKMNDIRIKSFISPPYTPEYKSKSNFELETKYTVKNSNTNDSIFFNRPSRFIASIWLIFEITLSCLLLICINVDIFGKIEHNCPTSLMYEQLTLYVNLYEGMSSKEGGCKNKTLKQKLSNDYCIGFDPRSSSIWTKIDNIIGTHMAFDCSVTLPAIQFLLSSAVFFAGLSFLTHGMLFTSRVMSDKNLYNILYWGIFYLIIVSILTSTALILINTTTDVLKPVSWGNLYEKGFAVEDIYSSVSNSSSYFNPTNVVDASTASKLCSVSFELGSGYILVLCSVLLSFILIVSIVFNSCCHRFPVCVDDNPADELDTSDRESRKSLINHR